MGSTWKDKFTKSVYKQHDNGKTNIVQGRLSPAPDQIFHTLLDKPNYNIYRLQNTSNMKGIREVLMHRMLTCLNSLQGYCLYGFMEHSPFLYLYIDCKNQSYHAAFNVIETSTARCLVTKVTSDILRFQRFVTTPQQTTKINLKQILLGWHYCWLDNNKNIFKIMVEQFLDVLIKKISFRLLYFFQVRQCPVKISRAF